MALIASWLLAFEYSVMMLPVIVICVWRWMANEYVSVCVSVIVSDDHFPMFSPFSARCFFMMG